MRRSPAVPAATPRKRASRKPKPVTWVLVESPCTPTPTSAELIAANATDLARKNAQRDSGRPRTPAQFTVGSGYYAGSGLQVPTLRLRGRWLEALGFRIGATVRVTVREGELLVSVSVNDAKDSGDGADLA